MKTEQQMSAQEPTTTQFTHATDVTTAVLTTVSDTTGTHIEELPALFDVVDPDALDAVFRSPRGGTPPTNVHLTFTFAGCRIDVHDGTVTASRVAEPQSGSRPVQDQKRN